MHPSTLSRRKFLTLSGAAAAAGLYARFAPATACPIPDLDPSDGAKELAKAINAFANDLHARLARDEAGTLFFSPFSIETALGMTSAGARGETLKEMQKALRLPADPHAAFGELINHLNGTNLARKRGYELTTANAIWAQQGFPWRKEFLELTRKHYGAGVVETDFGKPEAARKQINGWGEKETREKIKELIPKGIIDALTVMVLTNAIYFKGTWQYTFDKKNTKDAPFTRADNTKADVPLMHQTATLNYGTMHVGGRSGVGVQVLELPYTGNELSMLVYLPERADGANRLAGRLTADHIAAPKLTKREVKVWLPRFKAETEYSLKPALMDLGMKAAFTTADFYGMHTSDEYLFISHVLHKAFVEVNEEGTEAAAATAVVMKRASADVEPDPVFRADRPFVFVIRDNRTGVALFMGRYDGPR
jgi:serpin B